MKEIEKIPETETGHGGYKGVNGKLSLLRSQLIGMMEC
jgi:hypothetical protein